MAIKLNLYKILLLMVLILSCNNECKIDNTFDDLFLSSLNKIKNYYEVNENSISEEELDKAFFFITKITDRPSKRVAGHFGVIYHNREDYEQDILNWEKWYEENKCTYTMKDANIRFNKNSTSVTTEFKNWKEYFLAGRTGNK